MPNSTKRGGLGGSPGLPLAARLLGGCDAFIAVGSHNGQPTFSCRGFTREPAAAVATARALDQAATLALCRRIGASAGMGNTSWEIQIAYVMSQTSEPDLLDFLRGDEPSWPYEFRLRFARLIGGRCVPTRALAEKIVRKRIGTILRQDKAVALLLCADAPLQFRYSFGWYPSTETASLKVTFGVWDDEVSLPVMLSDACAANIVAALIATVPLRRKTATEFYDAPRRIRRHDTSTDPTSAA